VSKIVSKRWAEKGHDKELKIIMALLNYNLLPSPLRLFIYTLLQ
jgi:hypothetical protein